jgi:hypothetical protein
MNNKLALATSLAIVTTLASACSSTGSPGASTSTSQPAASTGAHSTSPSPTLPSQTPDPAEVSAAKDALDHYLRALVQADYQTAYEMLAPEAQAAQSITEFSYERNAFFKSVGGRYTITLSPSDVGPITSWLPPNAASVDLSHAVLIKVDYPALAGNNAGWELYIVSPGANGLEIFSVR